VPYNIEMTILFFLFLFIFFIRILGKYFKYKERAGYADALTDKLNTLKETSQPDEIKEKAIELTNEVNKEHGINI
jgi:hypothetical protein